MAVINESNRPLVIYDRPIDYPRHVVIRECEAPNGQPVLASGRILAIVNTVDEARQVAHAMGKSRLHTRIMQDPAVRDIWV